VSGIARRIRSQAGTRTVGAAIGILGALFLAVAMLPLRAHFANVFMALVLVIPVLVGAFMGGRLAGLASAAAATVCFDFFFTQPYLSLRIANRNDTATAIALLLLAATASELGDRLRRIDRSASAERATFDRLRRVVEISAHAADAEDVVSSACAELIGMFALDDCVFESVDVGPGTPRLGIDGAIAGGSVETSGADPLLAPGGVALPVFGRGREYGRLVLFTSRPVRLSRLERQIAISIADELGLALATQPSNDSR
jgi:GAF domain-containing protein